MRYWDASALVPPVVDEPASGFAREWLAEDERIITWPAFLTGFRREESETPSRATARSSRRARTAARSSRRIKRKGAYPCVSRHPSYGREERAVEREKDRC